MIDLSKEISEILEEYGAEVSGEVEKAVKMTAKDTVKRLKKHKGTYTIRSGNYNKSWKAKEEKISSRSTKSIVHNEKHYRLTHLLEYGHAKRGGGRTRAFPHISKAEESAKETLEREVRARLES